MNEDLRPTEDDPAVARSSRWETARAFVAALDAAVAGAPPLPLRADPGDAITLVVRPDGLCWSGRHLPVSEGASDWRAELYQGGVAALTLAPGDTALQALAEALTAALPPGGGRALRLAEAAPEVVAVTWSHARPRDLTRALDGAVRLGPGEAAVGHLRPARRLDLQPGPVGTVPAVHAPTVRSLREALSADLDPMAALRRALRDGPLDAPRPGLCESLRAWAATASPQEVRRLLVELDAGALAWLTAPGRLDALAPALADDPAPLLSALRPALRGRPEAWLQLAEAAPTASARSAALAEAEAAGAGVAAFHARRLEAADAADVLDAVAALERLADPEVPALLVPALAHADAAVRRAALHALGGRWSEVLRRPVVERLSDPDAEVRAAAVALAAASGDRRVAGALLARARLPALFERTEEERAALLAALARFDDGRVAAWFADLLADPNLTRRAALTRAQVRAVESLHASDARSARRVLADLQPRWHQPAALKAAIRAARSTG